MSLIRDEIFRQAGAKLRQDFLERSIVPHNQLKGAEAERLVRDFLDDHLPKRFRAGAGFVIDGRDQVSKQTDVLVYDALNCPVYRASENAGIYPSDNVAAVVEVKSVLSKAALRDAHDKIVAAKSLAKTATAGTPGLTLTNTMGCVFAFTSDISLDLVVEHVRELTIESGLGRHLDYVAVLDKGLVTLVTAMPIDTTWRPLHFAGPAVSVSEGSHVGFAAIQSGELTLDLFFRFLLGHLIFFREITPHPGFKWGALTPNPSSLSVHYLTSMAHNPDPAKRAEDQRRYFEDFKERFVTGKPNAEGHA